MSEDTGKITVSIPGNELDLLDDVDELVEEGGYDNRTDVFQDAIDNLVGEVDPALDEPALYDGAHSAYAEAHQEGLDEIKQNARDHIVNQYGQTRMLDKLDDILS